MSTLIANTLQGINTIKYDASTTAINIDSSGVVSHPARPSWLLLGIPASNTNQIASDSTIIWGEASFNPGTQSQTNGGCTYNTGNGQITIPKTGLYHIDVTLRVRWAADSELSVYLEGSTDNFSTSYYHASDSSSAGGRIILQISHPTTGHASGNQWNTLHWSGLVNLNNNEKLRVAINVEGGGNLETLNNDSQGGQWSGFFIG